MNDGERAQLLELATRLAEPELGVESRLDLVDRMRQSAEPQPAAGGEAAHEKRKRKTATGTAVALSRLPLGKCSLAQISHLWVSRQPMWSPQQCQRMLKNLPPNFL